MNSATLAYPLCVQGDSINNPNGCVGTNIIEDNSITFEMSIYPNPVKDNVTLIFTTTKAQQIQIKVLDMLGQALIQSNKQVNSGTNNIQINTQTLAKGFYVLSVRDGSNEIKVVKFVK